MVAGRIGGMTESTPEDSAGGLALERGGGEAEKSRDPRESYDPGGAASRTPIT